MNAPIADRLKETWRRTDDIFALLRPHAFLTRPIPLRHPYLIYLGHLPAIAWNHV